MVPDKATIQNLSKTNLIKIRQTNKDGYYTSEELRHRVYYCINTLLDANIQNVLKIRFEFYSN